MKVLVLGSGAKDHAVAWWFSKSRLIDGLFMAPANPGTEDYAVNIDDLDVCDKDSVLKACKKYGIDLVFAGTEDPLFTGVIDYLNENGIKTFGTPGYALKLEGDRRFAKEFAKRNNVSLQPYEVFDNTDSLAQFLDDNPGKTFAIKPNRVSPSRVMVNSNNPKELVEFAKQQLELDDCIILEKSMDAVGITISLLLDENGYFLFPVCSEYIKSEHGTEGEITGGLGAVCPIVLTSKTMKALRDNIINPTFDGLKKEGLLYKGILTLSVLVEKGKPFLVDYHVRFNDPAAQSIVPLVKNDLVEIMIAMQEGKVSSVELETNDKSSVSVVIASKGYPADTKVGFKLDPVRGNYMNNSLNSEACMFFGAVKRDENGDIVTTGGRAVTVVGLGENIIQANTEVYKAVKNISFEGAWFREDIGNKFFVSAATN